MSEKKTTGMTWHAAIEAMDNCESVSRPNFGYGACWMKNNAGKVVVDRLVHGIGEEATLDEEHRTATDWQIGRAGQAEKKQDSNPTHKCQWYAEAIAWAKWATSELGACDNRMRMCEVLSELLKLGRENGREVARLRELELNRARVYTNIEIERDQLKKRVAELEAKKKHLEEVLRLIGSAAGEVGR